ncbi:hypothetical protein L1887_39620 [Cichorium endivia]|nr:hypothetical protein L1887_39620 [Cichorium endivia]
MTKKEWIKQLPTSPPFHLFNQTPLHISHFSLLSPLSNVSHHHPPPDLQIQKHLVYLLATDSAFVSY